MSRDRQEARRNRNLNKNRKKGRNKKWQMFYDNLPTYLHAFYHFRYNTKT
jgi:hypothetical protein